jgi:hypothetical protein
MKVLVCGGRGYGVGFGNYHERQRAYDALNRLDYGKRISAIIEGGAAGADACGAAWAQAHNVETQTFPADWSEHGKAAGPMRNQRMIDEGKPDLVVAFPGGKGTADMVRRARAAGIEIQEIAP